MRTIVLALLVACSPSPSPSPPPSPSPSPSQTKTLEAPKDLTSLAARMRYEAAHRPEAGPHAEQVLDAIDANGLTVLQRRQYLGVAVHARYCAGGTTKDGLAISICEYATPADAARGKTYADRQFAAISDAQRAARGNALITIVGARPEAARALHVFETL